EVTLIDEVHQVEKPYRIYMNNILKYRGYRFFQSSYDQDELGTILSVNYDSVGTAVTYFGYFIMTMGMIFTFFSRSSRFRRLVRSSAKLRLKREQIFAPLLILGLFLSVTQLSAQTSANVVSKEHAREFGKLQVQNIDGRIEPVNTLASEFLRKVAKKNSYEGLTPVQLFLEMTIEPKAWLSAPLIKVSHPDMKKLLGVGGDFASLHNFFGSNHDNSYKLGTLVEQTFEKKPVQRTKFDKEIITVDERVNLLYQMLNGTLLRVFPAPGDDNQKWADLTGILMQDDHTMSDFASSTMRGYSTALITARQTADYSAALEYLNQLKSKQADLGAAIYPSSFKTALEVFYINFNLYSKLSKFYVLAGLILLVLHILVLLKPTLKVKTFTKTGFWVVMALFLVHTAGLGIRWYISGHAPWSNGYETLLYISWSTCLAGLIFAKRSPITLSVTAILSAITLFVAGMSWMNPELTNLVPVLKSFWLIIHVAIITASYGFLGMTALLGLVNLMVMIIRNPLNSTRINLTIKELGFIIEIALIVGLFLLTIGSFLGGVWANESWGRYWGWDPKETWAMVTILVYAFIVHTHKIPGFRGSFALSAFALIGFSSVLMTFFGVNYYLSGLHSYAQGDPPPVPAGVYITAVMVLFIVAMAYLSQRNQQRTGIEMLNGED
ncbi:MAG: cytochrome c biogenesis protein CcsA, partial [Bacteroidales bacterium]|nr:cytochrome c biogenesis protein CcsA [Bacteroidales bacterium]